MNKFEITDGEWRWHHANKSFDGAFTDWSPDADSYQMVTGPRCLLIPYWGDSYKKWVHYSCSEWKHFICELPPEVGDAESPKASNLVSAKKCLKGQKADGNLTQDADGKSSQDTNGHLPDICYRFVQLQYTSKKAEDFCRKKFNGSLAVVESAHRHDMLALLMEENSIVNRQWGGIP